MLSKDNNLAVVCLTILGIVALGVLVYSDVDLVPVITGIAGAIGGMSMAGRPTTPQPPERPQHKAGGQ